MYIITSYVYLIPHGYSEMIVMVLKKYISTLTYGYCILPGSDPTEKKKKRPSQVKIKLLTLKGIFQQFPFPVTTLKNGIEVTNPIGISVHVNSLDI